MATILPLFFFSGCTPHIVQAVMYFDADQLRLLTGIVEKVEKDYKSHFDR